MVNLASLRASVFSRLAPRITISRWITGIVVAGFLVATTALGYMALSILSENKRRDFWAMIFMTVEIRGNQISRALQESAGMNNPELRARPAMVLRGLQDGNFEVAWGGGAGDRISPADFKLQGTTMRARYNLLSWRGRNFVAQLAEQRMVLDLLGRGADGNAEYHFLWPVNLLRVFGAEATASGPGVFYAVTTEGDLLVSTSRDITSANFASRRLVQRFVGNEFRQGQLEYVDPSGKSMLGVFFEIPESNVVLFSETPKDNALGPVYQLRKRYVALSLLTLLLTVVVVLFALRPVVDPMADLVRVAAGISSGDFSVRPALKGIGETEILNMAFLAMAKDLEARDMAINMLHEEQKGKIRLEAELAVAKSIQDNFMPRDAIAPESSVFISTSYTPAAEAAGDWYSYSFDESTGESVVAIADVSGHGAGSAMFTAIIAGMFEYHRRISTGQPFPVEAFFRGCNHLILTLGRTKWHATMQLATWNRGSGEITLYNAGHPPAIVTPPAGASGTEPEVIAPASHVIGMAAEFDLGEQKVAFPVGASLLMYTDGLLEGANAEGTQFGQRRILRACRASVDMIPVNFVEKVVEDWRKHLAGTPQDDDVCVMVMKRVA